MHHMSFQVGIAIQRSGYSANRSLGLAVWRRIGELATDILALGLNKEVTYTFVPVFLAELRRRTFAKAYYLDKMFAAVFNRPPRMTARHADCALPLDLSDEEILRSGAEIYQAKRKLTEDECVSGPSPRVPG